MMEALTPGSSGRAELAPPDPERLAEMQGELDGWSEKITAAEAGIKAKDQEAAIINADIDAAHDRKAGQLAARDRIAAEMEAAAEQGDANAQKRVKDILSKVYASLGEQFVDGDEFDGAVIRAAIKAAILNAMRG